MPTATNYLFIKIVFAKFIFSLLSGISMDTLNYVYYHVAVI